MLPLSQLSSLWKGFEMMKHVPKPAGYLLEAWHTLYVTTEQWLLWFPKDALYE